MSDVGQETRPNRAGGPMLDLVASKLPRPVGRPGTVDRVSLIEQLAYGDPRPVISVFAPAGYGKTTLLSQWAECGWQALAWVSVDEGDDDPRVLLTYIAEALDAVSRSAGGFSRRSRLPRVQCPARSSRGWRRHSSRCPRRSCWCWMTCMYCTTSNVGSRCRCWPITCRTGRGWCWPGGPIRRYGSRGCVPRAGSWKLAPVGGRRKRRLDDLAAARQEVAATRYRARSGTGTRSRGGERPG